MVRDAERICGLSWDSFAVGGGPWCAVWRSATARVTTTRLPTHWTRLRRDANWAYLKPKRKRLRERFLGQLQAHLDRAESGSLAAMLASMPGSRETAAADQAAHWLFAFEAAGMASFRGLALLDAHPAQCPQVRDELRDMDLSIPQELPFLRATVLESVRLWPTTRAPAPGGGPPAHTRAEAGTRPRPPCPRRAPPSLGPVRSESASRSRARAHWARAPAHRAPASGPHRWCARFRGRACRPGTSARSKAIERRARHGNGRRSHPAAG